MKVRFSISSVALVIALAVMVLLAFRTESLHARINSLETQMTALKSVAVTHAIMPDMPSNIPDIATPVVTAACVNPASAMYATDQSHSQAPANIVPVHVITQKTTLHPGLIYDVFSDGDQPLDLRITLTNPIRMTKIFDCHVMPGKGNHCEIGYDQGFSSIQGDTLTIQAFNYMPLVLTP